MQANEVFWHYFQQTGNIGSYLLIKQLEDEEESVFDDFLDEEDFGGFE